MKKFLGVLGVIIALIIDFATAFLNLNPSSSLNLPADLSNGKISISLKERPTGKVMLYFDSPKTRFDRCALEFTRHNWNQPQTVQAISESFATDSQDDRNIPIIFQAWSDDCSWPYQGHTLNLNTVRDRRKEGACIVYGDPHYKSFDFGMGAGVEYHYQGTGVFYLVQSEFLTVQAWQGSCWNGASCVYAVGIRYGEAVFYVDGSQSDIDHYVRAITHTHGVTISKTRTDAINTINLAFNSGSNIKLDFYKGPDWFTNVFINLGTYLHGRVRGLCGTYDRNPDNDFTSSSNKVFRNEDVMNACAPDWLNKGGEFAQTSLNKFASSWLVPVEDSIFEGKRVVNKYPLDYVVNQCIRPPASSIKCTNTEAQYVEPVPCMENWNANWAVCGNRCRRAVVPNTMQGNNSEVVLPPPIAAASVPSGHQVQDVIHKYDGKKPKTPKPKQYVEIPKDVLDAATSQCAVKIGRIDGCTVKNALETAVQNCKYDIEAGGNPKTIYEIHNLAYTELCAHALLSLAEDPNQEIAQRAKAALIKHSFGNTECDQQCLQCTDRGCSMCRDPIAYVIKGGHCVRKTEDDDNKNDKFFSPPPVKSLLSRKEVAPQISTNEALGQTNGRHDVNPQALREQKVGKLGG